ncbi:MAG: hypothetical protein MUD12_16360 [Spirochaetes bacterium]|nr:hypothetical protein [Spirochaetota bacterium]
MKKTAILTAAAVFALFIVSHGFADEAGKKQGELKSKTDSKKYKVDKLPKKQVYPKKPIGTAEIPQQPAPVNIQGKGGITADQASPESPKNLGGNKSAAEIKQQNLKNKTPANKNARRADSAAGKATVRPKGKSIGTAPSGKSNSSMSDWSLGKAKTADKNAGSNSPPPNNPKGGPTDPAAAPASPYAPSNKPGIRPGIKQQTITPKGRTAVQTGPGSSTRFKAKQKQKHHETGPHRPAPGPGPK